MESRVKCMLPSISNLLGLAGAGSPTNESLSTSSLLSDATSKRYSTFTGERSLGSDAPLDSRPHSNTAPQFSLSSKPASLGCYYEAMPPLESGLQRQTHHASQPSHGPLPSYTLQAPPAPDIGQQRALPQSLPPANMPSQAPSAVISWQHHHYLPPASDQLPPRSQNRHICQTCNKAFSRPSGLRTHSRSHTGEKHFKCLQAGCGRTFSVRSNMKRHERGCHSLELEPDSGMMSEGMSMSVSFL